MDLKWDQPTEIEVTAGQPHKLEVFYRDSTYSGSAGPRRTLSRCGRERPGLSSTGWISRAGICSERT